MKQAGRPGLLPGSAYLMSNQKFTVNINLFFKNGIIRKQFSNPCFKKKGGIDYVEQSVTKSKPILFDECRFSQSNFKKHNNNPFNFFNTVKLNYNVG